MILPKRTVSHVHVKDLPPIGHVLVEKSLVNIKQSHKGQKKKIIWKVYILFKVKLLVLVPFLMLPIDMNIQLEIKLKNKD